MLLKLYWDFEEQFNSIQDVSQFPALNYSMRKLRQVYFKGILYSSSNILHFIVSFSVKHVTKHEFYKSPRPQCKQDLKLTQVIVFCCDVIFDKFPVELLIM